MSRQHAALAPLEAFDDEAAARIETLFTDIDDTLSDEGRITSRAFDAMWRAHDAGVRVVAVTGRPAGWCDHLARMWPVAAVVGENGALCYAMIDGAIQRLYAERPADAAERLAAIERDVLAEVRGCKVAADQPFRLYDLAIDFCEEVPRIDDAGVRRIVEVFERHGATAKVSSIHVNGWFGQFDKLSMCRRAMQELFDVALDARCVYIGDSPNDEPMFAAFEHSVGVANVRDLADYFQTLPRYITRGRSGGGFAELVDHLLSARR
ncbi:MAG: HAD-IIB family hydrolase [Myxococcales bacterium]|nr:HAD-IIB family hydrolase [Myxococcales bacterium]